MTRRNVLLAASLAALLGAMVLAGDGPALAQVGTTRIVVSFPPGGPVDFVARSLAGRLGGELGQTVIVDNKPGANGAIGASEVLRSAPDGRALWITSVGATAINPALYEHLPYDMRRDLAPVSLVVNNVELLVVNPKNPANSTVEFVAASKRRKELTPMASSGIGSIPHLAIEQLIDATGARLLHVPYKGAAPAITDLIGGQVAGFFGDIPGLIGHVRGGRLKPIGLAAKERHPALPEVATLAEQGIPGVDTNNWYALFAPARTPPATIDQINQAVRRALSDPVLRDKLLSSGAEPAPSTPQELDTLLRHDTEKWAKLIRARNIRPE